MLSLTELGLGTALSFKLYKPLAERDEHRVRVLMKFYKQAYRVIGLAIFVLGLCLLPFLPLLIKDYDSLATLGINATLIYMLYLLQSVSSYLFFAYRSEVMREDQKTYILNIADFGINIATYTVQILVLILLKNFVVYTAVIIAFTVIRNLFDALIAQHYYPQFFIKEEDSLSKEEVFGLFKDCGALFVEQTNTVIIKSTDNLVISSFIGLSAVGLYSNYLLLYNIIKNFLIKLYNAVKASAGNYFATESSEKKYLFFETLNFVTFILFGTAAVGITVCGNEFILCWIGEDYLIPQPLAGLIGLEILLVGFGVNLGQIRNITGVFR